MQTERFTSIEDLNDHVTSVVRSLHSENFLVFLGGSFARGSFTDLSDIDYTACVDGSVSHSRFYFKIIKLENKLRLLSIYFFKYDEILIDDSKVDDEVYLWMKEFIPETKFISGDKTTYDNLMAFYSNLKYTREPKDKTIHKSFGKLFELILRIKKWEQKGDFAEMVYYGTKLAEHVRRIVIEINGPIAVKSENVYLDAHYTLPKLPKDFKKLYMTVSRLNIEAITTESYFAACRSLVVNTIDFLNEYKEKLDSWSKGLLESDTLEDFLSFKV